MTSHSFLGISEVELDYVLLVNTLASSLRQSQVFDEKCDFRRKQVASLPLTQRPLDAAYWLHLQQRIQPYIPSTIQEALTVKIQEWDGSARLARASADTQREEEFAVLVEEMRQWLSAHHIVILP